MKNVLIATAPNILNILKLKHMSSYNTINNLSTIRE